MEKTHTDLGSLPPGGPPRGPDDGFGLEDGPGNFDGGGLGDGPGDPRGLSVEAELLDSPGFVRMGNRAPGARRVPVEDVDAEEYDLGLTEPSVATGEARASDDVLAGISGSDARVGDSSRGGKSNGVVKDVSSRMSSSS